MAGDRDQVFDECVRGFMERDYPTCIQRAVALCQTPPGATVRIMQLLLMSLLRVGQTEAAEHMGAQFLAAVSSRPWHAALLRLTLGQMAAPQVLDMACDEKQRCMAHYFAGARHVVQGHVEQAVVELDACVATGVDCLERDLAMLDRRDAANIARSLPAESHRVEVAHLNERVAKLCDQGQYKEAVALAREAHESAHEHLDEGLPEYSCSLNNLAWVLQAQGEFVEAEGLYVRSVELDRKFRGDDHPDYATALRNLGELYRKTGRSNEAERCYRQSLEIRERALGKTDSLVAQCHNDLGMVYGDIGEYMRAESSYREALDMHRKTLGERHPDVACVLNNLGDLYRLMGNYPAAEWYLHEASDIVRSELGDTHPYLATAVNNLAAVQEAMGNYSAADRCFREAVRIRREVLGESHPEFATNLSNWAKMYMSMGDFESAEPLLKQASEIMRSGLGERHPDFAQSLNNLAVLYTEMGKPESAEPLLQLALRIRQAALGPEHPDVAQTLNNLASVRRASNKAREAIEILQRVVEIRRASQGEGHPDVAAGLHNLGVVFLELGEYGQSEPVLRQALEMNRAALGESHPDVAESLASLAHLAAATDRPKEALDLLKQAAAIEDQALRQVVSIASEKQRMTFLGTTRAKYSALLSLVLQYLSHSDDAVRAAFDLTLRRKGIGAEVLAAQRDAVFSGRYPELASELRTLTSLRRQIAQKTLAGAGPEGGDAHRATLAKWTTQREQLEAKLAREISEIALQEKLQTADRRAVASALPKDAVMVEFVRFHVLNFTAAPGQGQSQIKPARYLAFVMTADDPDHVSMVDLGEAERIERMIAAFRADITGQSRLRDLGVPEQESVVRRDSDTGLALRAALFDPLVPAFRGCTQLLLSPDGDVTRLPFEVLPFKDTHRLIDDYQISYVTVGRDVLAFAERSRRPSVQPVVIADPDFDLAADSTALRRMPGRREGHSSRELERANLHFCRLPGTREEGQRVAEALGVQPWLDADAVESRIKECRSPHILHLATHGFFLDDQPTELPSAPADRAAAARMTDPGTGRLSAARLENPLLRSGLALAGANTWLRRGSPPDDAEDGLLTAEDVTGLDLLDTELVVLSACETGLGEVRLGEGVFGLRRAFALAGAKTLVMSLWKVPDEQTQQLMTEFYRRILTGEGCAEALRGAQLLMKQRYPDPLYWGGFVCQGAPGRF